MGTYFSSYPLIGFAPLFKPAVALIVQDNTAGQRQDQPAAAPPAAQVCISSSSLRFICCQLSTALLLVSPILAPLLILLACFIRLHHFLSAFLFYLGSFPFSCYFCSDLPLMLFVVVVFPFLCNLQLLSQFLEVSLALLFYFLSSGTKLG